MVFEALKFMALGMSIVFLFLILMIIVLNIQHKIISHFFPIKKDEPNVSTSNNRNNLNKVKQAAIATVAIKQYIKDKGV